MIYIQPKTNELVQDLLNDDLGKFSYKGAYAIVEFLKSIHSHGNDQKWDASIVNLYYSEYKSFDELKSDYEVLSDEELEDKIVARGDDFIIVFEG
jgi:hypothetical protein